VRITRIVTSVIEIVEEEPGGMSIRQAWPAPISSPARAVSGSGMGVPAFSRGGPSGQSAATSTVAVGAAVVGAASAAAALLSNEHVRRKVAIGATRVRSALEAVRNEASRRAAALRAAQRRPRALPAPVVDVSSSPSEPDSGERIFGPIA